MNAELLTWFLVFVRASSLLAVFPLFSVTNVPIQIRIAIGAAVAFLVAPLLPVSHFDVRSAQFDMWSVFGLIFVEASVGLLLGFISRLVLFGLEMAGAIISTEMGLMISSSFNPFSANVVAAPGLLLFWLAMMLLLSLDLHHWMIAAFERSYALVPIGGAHLTQALLANVIASTGKTFIIAVQVAAPVMAVSFIITVIFSILGRAVPQMNVFAESFSARTLAGMFVFGLTCNVMAQHIANYLRRLPEDFMRVAQILTP